LIKFFPRLVTKMNIGNLIHAERKAKGKTLAEIGDALAISRNTVWQLERLNRGSMVGLERISQYLGVEWIGLPPGSSLGNRIWAERLRRGWTQEALANKAGISRPALARVEDDRAYISTLCSVLDVIAPDVRPRKPVIPRFVKSRDIRLTPPDFVEQVVSVLGDIELDPCGHPNSFIPAARQYFEEDDGLLQAWNAKTVFCNPPYSIAAKFMRKAHSEWLSGSAKCIVLLITLRTYTISFHDIAGYADMIFLRDRLRFWSAQQTPLPDTAPFSSVVMIFGGDEGVIERARATWGGVFVPKRKLD
jgi:transcriptional regulator with XRE-family HTH domain